MQYKFNWGILAGGHIARKFAEGMTTTGQSYIKAVASRKLEKAQKFASELGIEKAYGDYQSLVEDPDIDIIYVASPHSYHLEHALLALEHGKHVLCEKPITVNSFQLVQLIAKAREKNLFLMEALWTRFLPVMVQVREWLKEGIIGEPRLLRASFNFRAESIDLDSRLFNPDLAGGALLDVGIYPIMFSSMIFGEAPTSIHTAISKAPTGVDFQSAYLFQYEDGAIATLSSGFEAAGTMNAMIIGTKGEIKIPFFWKGKEAVVSYPDGSEQLYRFPFESSGLQYQALHMMECMDKGLLESPIMPLNESLEIQHIMDKIRRDWGLKYPFED